MALKFNIEFIYYIESPHIYRHKELIYQSKFSICIYYSKIVGGTIVGGRQDAAQVLLLISSVMKESGYNSGKWLSDSWMIDCFKASYHTSNMNVGRLRHDAINTVRLIQLSIS